MGVFCIVFFGCAALKPSQVTKNDCALVFPRTDDYEKLTSPDGQPYYEAWERGFADDVDEFLGYVFPETFLYEGNNIKIIIGLSKSKKISNIVVLSIQSVSEEFMSQFKGRSSGDSFEIAQTPDDLLSIPSKLKPMSENVLLSRKIASIVKEILISASSVPAR